MSKLFLTVLSFLFVGLVVIGAGMADAQVVGPPRTLSGNVVDSAGGAIAGVDITLLDTAGTVKGKTATDAEGHFSISAVQPGEYVLQAQRKDFETSRMNVRFAETADSSVPTLRITLQIKSVQQVVNVTAPGVYTVPNASAATKVELPIMDTPVSVQVIPAQVLADQQTVNLVDAITNVSGVAPTNDSYGTGDSFSIRGFDALSVLYQDGIKLDEYSASGFPQDMADVEEVEVVKGPASVLYGQAEPGGLVNVVTKKPREEPFTTIEQQFANHEFFRTTADLNRPLIQDKLFFRFVLDGTDADSFRHFIYNHEFNIYPSLLWRPNKFLEFTMQGAYETGSNVLDNGIPFINNATSTTGATRTWLAPVPLSSNFADPGLNRTPNTQYSLKPTLTIHLAKDWPLRLQYRFEHFGNPTPIDEIYSGDADEAGDLPRLAFTTGYFHHRTDQVVADLPGKFSIGPVKNTFLIGFDFYKESGAYDYNTVFPQSINIYNPVYNQPYPPPDPTQEGYNTQGWSEYGAYIQDLVELPGHVFVLAGLRMNWAVESEDYAGVYVANTVVHDRPATPRAGVLWQANPHVSFYGSYTSNYGASALGLLNPNGQFLPPESATQVEFGAKTEWLNQRLTASTAVYRIIKRNIPTADPQDPIASIAIGAARTQGVEFDLSGEITPDLRIIGGYSSLQALTTHDDNIPSFQGLPFPSVPHNLASLWGVWEPHTHAMHGFKFGAGMQTRSGEQAYEYDFDPISGAVYYLPDRIPSFVVVNFMGGYDRVIGNTHMSLQVNINNLLNRHYFSNVTPFQALPGAPLTIIPALHITF